MTLDDLPIMISRDDLQERRRQPCAALARREHTCATQEPSESLLRPIALAATQTAHVIVPSSMHHATMLMLLLNLNRVFHAGATAAGACVVCQAGTYSTGSGNEIIYLYVCTDIAMVICVFALARFGPKAYECCLLICF